MQQESRFHFVDLICVVLCAAGIGLLLFLGIRKAAAGTNAVSAHQVAAMPTSALTIVTEAASRTVQPVVQTSACTVQTMAAVPSASTIAAATQTAAPVVSFPLELNEASAEELAALPGIGDVLAQRIVTYRSHIGGFQNREQLLEVEGIGQNRLAQIRELLYLQTEYALESVQTQPALSSTTAQPAAPAVTEAAPVVTEAAPSAVCAQPAILVDLNTADMETFLTLPGMTEALAGQILELRDSIGCFSSPYELLYAEDMTPDYFNEIRDIVQIGT